jgi:two-component system sensor histidine kinase BarA
VSVVSHCTISSIRYAINEIWIMRIDYKHIWRKLTRFLRLWPLSLARKVQVTFGAAVILVLMLAFSILYVWMGQLTKKDLFDIGRSRSRVLLDRHFQLKAPAQTLPPLDAGGQARDANDAEITWIRFTEEGEKSLSMLSGQVAAGITTLRTSQDREESILTESRGGQTENVYIRIFRATDRCLSCHNPQGTASALGFNEPVGAVIIRSRDLAGEIGRTVFMNRFWIVVAGLIGGAGAIIAFYMITQNLILRPIRQLRALANNVAEGNLEIRSSIATGDEYEKLARAFNHMLDRLVATQEKLRQANKQLDAKIAELSERNIDLFKANKVKGYAENIITSGNNLLKMINDLLDLAKTQAGKMELHIEKASVESLLENVLSQFSLLTKKKKIKTRLVLGPNLPPLETDIGKVQQILYNFLSNAVKFTPARGRIEIEAQFPSPGAPDTGPEPRMIRIAVTDTGCGIAEPDREKIFEKFRQADGSITRESTGSGLGLAISKELAAMLAGGIGLASPPQGRSEGSMFWLDIPITLTKEEKQETQRAASN